MNESELLTHIEARSRNLLAGGGWSVQTGPGDDCAVLRGSGGSTLLVGVDQLVAGRHFDAGATPIDLIARKAVARSVSDIAAMGGRPAWGLATALLPAGYAHADELFDAMAACAQAFGCPLVGGDIASHASADEPLTLTVTVAGTMPGGHGAVLRSGARAGDRLWLTGPVGGSLASGRHLTFEPRIEAGLACSAPGSGAHAMLDLSDGLGRDAGRIARASGVVLEIDAQAVPLHAGVGGWRAGASEGEDHELLIAFDPSSAAPAGLGLLGPIGRVLAPGEGETPGVVFLDGARRVAGDELGWTH
ncbi:MAG: thiamine-phosphate kinase [Planctomycetota bacterium]